MRFKVFLRIKRLGIFLTFYIKGLILVLLNTSLFDKGMVEQWNNGTSFFIDKQAFHCFSFDFNTLHAILFPNIPTIQYSNIPFSDRSELSSIYYSNPKGESQDVSEFPCF